MVDQNWDRDAEGAGEKRLPQFQGPLDAVAADVRQKGQGSVIQFPGLSSFFVGLEHQHLLPENRVVIEGKIFLCGFKEALLSEACLLIGLTEGNEWCVIPSAPSCSFFLCSLVFLRYVPRNRFANSTM